uniref:Acyl-peptide hydrolase n=1 Tax=Thermorudis peleae TaxID=1382356 RepID=A0A831X0D1_9BACT
MAEERTGKRRLAPEDIYEIALVSDAQISPDGQRVAFVRTVLDRERNDYRSSIWLVDVAGGEPVRFTAADARDSFPRWSPRGDWLAFLSNRSGKDQVWLISLGGGEAQQLTRFPEPVTYFAWSPDGTTLAVVTKAETAGPPEKEPEPETDVVRITRIRYRSDGTPGFLDDKRSHIWCVPVDGGRPWQVTSGDFDESWPAWSPSGHEIAFVSNRTPDREYNTVSEIWAVRASGGEPRPVATGDAAYFFKPVWSPDGTALAFTGHREPFAGSSRNHQLWAVAAGGGEPASLTAGLDRSVEDEVLTDTAASSKPGPIWAPDGQWIYTQVSDQGNVHLYRIPAGGGEPQLVVGGRRRVVDFSLSADGSLIACTVSEPLNPCDVIVCSADGSGERRLTRVNEEFFATVELSEPEEVWLPSASEDRRPIHAWIMKPIGFREGVRYPLVLEIHGGPHAMYGNVYFHEFQLLAAQGYVVLYTNPRGSQGYGQQFLSCTRGAWGEADMPDLMGAVDAVIERGYIDPSRLGVTGGSYGGFMTNWVIGHTDRFKAAVTQRCVSNLASFYGTSDIGFHFGEHEIGGTPWEQPELYRRLSPLTYAPQMKTPLLILHSEQDYRCPIEQAEQLYVWLKKLGRTVEFVRFPDESHGLSRSGKPKHRVERLQHILRWFAEYL